MLRVRSSVYGRVIVVMTTPLAFVLRDKMAMARSRTAFFARRAANGAAARSATRVFQFGGQLELPKGIVPHALENTRDRSERIPPGAVEALAAVGAHLNETGVLQGAQLEGHRSEGDVRHRRGDGARVELLRPNEAQDLLAARRGN